MSQEDVQLDIHLHDEGYFGNLDWGEIMELEDEKRSVRQIVDAVEAKGPASRKRFPSNSPSSTDPSRRSESRHKHRRIRYFSPENRKRLPFSRRDNLQDRSHSSNSGCERRSWSKYDSRDQGSDEKRGNTSRCSLEKMISDCRERNSARSCDRSSPTSHQLDSRRSLTGSGSIRKDNRSPIRIKQERRSPSPTLDGFHGSASLKGLCGISSIKLENHSPVRIKQERRSPSPLKEERLSPAPFKEECRSPNPELSNWERGPLGTLIEADCQRQRAKDIILAIERKRGDANLPKSPKRSWSDIMQEEVAYTRYFKQNESPIARSSSLCKSESTESLESGELSSQSSSGGSKSTNSDGPYENNKDVLQRRQKQIDYGKNTICYQNYVKAIRRNKRSSEHPVTPNKWLKFSRRSFDQQIRIWRKQLHTWEQLTDVGRITRTVIFPTTVDPNGSFTGSISDSVTDSEPTDLGYSSSSFCQSNITSSPRDSPTNLEEILEDEETLNSNDQVIPSETIFWKALNLDAMFLDDSEETSVL